MILLGSSPTRARRTGDCSRIERLIKLNLIQNINAGRSNKRWFDGYLNINGKEYLIFTPESFLVGNIGILIILGLFKTFIDHQQAVPLDIIRTVITYTVGGYFGSRFGAIIMGQIEKFLNCRE